MSESLFPDGPASRPMTPLAAALWSVALTIVVRLAVTVTASVRPGAENDIVNLTACQVLATSLVIFAIVRWHAPELPMRGVTGALPMAPLHGLFAIAAGAGLVPLCSALADLVLRRFPIAEDDAAESIHKMLTSSSRTGVLLAVLVVVPVALEVFYRGVVFSGVRATVGPRVAILATSVFYACSFVQPQQMPAALLVGLALGWLREQSGSVFAPILAQLAYGAVEGIPILRGRDLEAEVTYPSKWIAGGAVIAVLALVGVAAGSRTREGD